MADDLAATLRALELAPAALIRVEKRAGVGWGVWVIKEA